MFSCIVLLLWLLVFLCELRRSFSNELRHLKMAAVSCLERWTELVI